jgi:transmembrane sensor
MVRQRDGLSPAERQALQAWLAESPLHEAALKRAHDDSLMLGVVLAQIPRERLLPEAPSNPGRRQLLAAAGALAAGAGAAWLGASWLARPRPQRYLTGGTDGPQVIPLPGLQLVLAAATEVLVGEAGPRSARLLRGEALFTVATGTLPLVVHASDWLISSPQASFALRQAAPDVDLTLQSGRVDVLHTGSHPLTTRLSGLEAGRLRASGALEVHALSDAELRARLAWCAPPVHEGGRQMLLFEDQPLREVVAELNRHGGPRVVITDPGLAARHITAGLPAGDSQALVNLVRSQFGAQVTKEGGEIRLFMR